MILLYLFLIIGICLVVWGSQTRGTWSRKIAILGGIVWIAPLILIFINYDIRNGLIAAFVSFVIGAVCQRIFPKKI